MRINQIICEELSPDKVADIEKKFSVDARRDPEIATFLKLLKQYKDGTIADANKTALEDFINKPANKTHKDLLSYYKNHKSEVGTDTGSSENISGGEFARRGKTANKDAIKIAKLMADKWEDYKVVQSKNADLDDATTVELFKQFMNSQVGGSIGVEDFNTDVSSPSDFGKYISKKALAYLNNKYNNGPGKPTASTPQPTPSAPSAGIKNPGEDNEIDPSIPKGAKIKIKGVTFEYLGQAWGMQTPNNKLQSGKIKNITANNVWRKENASSS